MRIVFYGNKQAGMIGLLTALAMGKEVVEVWEDEGFGIPGLNWLPIKRRKIYSRSDLMLLGSDVEADLLLCIHGRKIVPEETLQKFKYGGVNLHPFLDKYPGSRPVARALLARERIASVYAHQMTSEVDKGEIVAYATTQIPTIDEHPDLDVVHIYNHLYPLYALVTSEVLKLFASKQNQTK